MNDKQFLIDTIRQHNPSAGVEFLTTFDEKALGQYLDHLVFRTQPRDRQATWVRNHDARAFTAAAIPG